MVPVFVDVHIHTSENPNKLDANFDVEKLLENVKNTGGDDFLIALSDHNTINKQAYLNILRLTDKVILAAELHIQNYEGRPPYHCHIIFNVDSINDETIDNINNILDSLYPNKVIEKDQKEVPSISEIVNKFDKYEFLLLPHGGQSHSTFNKSIPKGVVFDTTIERSIYYNQFDGFTARSNDKLEETQAYFHRLGIKEFVNLLTCSDNYDPSVYPQAKDPNAARFLPTWMFASPTFEGLRLSLSEASRFTYSEIKPENWSEYIGKVALNSEKININVELLPGLNVVIGGSSSGKTLFVDSIYKKICDDFADSKYQHFNVSDIQVVNRSGLKPHYINQNFIMTILSSEDRGIEEIDMVNKVFPLDEDIDKQIQNALAQVKSDINTLIDCTKKLADTSEELLRIPVISSLITKGKIKDNMIAMFIQDNVERLKYTLKQQEYEEYTGWLQEIKTFLTGNPFCNDISTDIKKVFNELDRAYEISQFESQIHAILTSQKKAVDEQLKSDDLEQQSKKQNTEKLYRLVAEYIEHLNTFYSTLNKISKYDVKCKTNSLSVMGHDLSIENHFGLSKESVLEAINKFLKTEFKIANFSNITPEKLLIDCFSKKSPKINSYNDAKKYIYSEFEKANKKTYKITTKYGQAFESLSPGWKSAVLLDIILGYDKDVAPLIIDQPEDNLATNYINSDLIDTIKKIKARKQIILVSHNATIPMLGDAQNVVLCKNDDGKININSQPLEGKIDGKSMVDYIAEITDGGKPSIKKRVKKYNLKTFKEE